MSQIQHLILTILSILVVVLLAAQVLLVHQATIEQTRLTLAQQNISLGQGSKNMVNQLAARLYEESQKSPDPALKELLIRQQIKYNPPTDGAGSSSAPTPAPATH